MTTLRCATHIVVNAASAAARFGQWLDYEIVELGNVPADLAKAWLAPASAGRRYAILRPSSGAAVFLRLIEGDPVASYMPIRTFGWAAIEICVQDVAAVHTRMLSSPFEVIGPPNAIPGFSAILPMQVRGPDQETIYLTQINADGPSFGLPVPASPIDRPFILVLACQDLGKTSNWFRDVLCLDVTTPVAIPYSMIAKAFGLNASDLHDIATVSAAGELFLELDQYPTAATSRAAHPGALPPGVAIVSIATHTFDDLSRHWISAPAARGGIIYQGRRVGVLSTPEGALIEVVESGP